MGDWSGEWPCFSLVREDWLLDSLHQINSIHAHGIQPRWDFRWFTSFICRPFLSWIQRHCTGRLSPRPPGNTSVAFSVVLRSMPISAISEFLKIPCIYFQTSKSLSLNISLQDTGLGAFHMIELLLGSIKVRLQQMSVENTVKHLPGLKFCWETAVQGTGCCSSLAADSGPGACPEYFFLSVFTKD